MRFSGNVINFRRNCGEKGQIGEVAYQLNSQEVVEGFLRRGGGFDRPSRGYHILTGSGRRVPVDGRGLKVLREKY
jgi:hypothetical protein